MPNTLVHFAAQGAASRGIWRRLDARWIYLGCLLPDVPWILRRAAAAFGLPIDPFELRLYSMAQASLLGTLLLCAGLALTSAAPRLVFGALGLNALLHLLLDASEIKWGNGVHLLAPFSWRMTSFDLLGSESVVWLALSLAGALLVAWELVRRQPSTIGFELRPRRLAVAAAACAVYLLAPLAFMGAIEATDSYSVKTLRELERRPGRAVSFDRTAFLKTPAGDFVEIWTGERLRVVGATPDHEARISLRGTFVASDLLRVDQLEEHRSERDWPSYAALGLLVLLWVRPRLAGATRRPGAT